MNNKKYLLANLKTGKGIYRIRYFQLLSYLSLTLNILLIYLLIKIILKS